MLRNKAAWWVASAVGVLVALCIAPFSFSFLSSGLVSGLLLVALIYFIRTPKDKWLPDLAFGLTGIVATRVTMHLLFPKVESNSPQGWSLTLLYVSIVGFVYFGYGWIDTRKRLGGGDRIQPPIL